MEAQDIIDRIEDGGKRRRYAEALKEIQEKNMYIYKELYNTTRKSFVKQEKVFGKTSDKLSNRLIQGVSDAATLTTL